MIPKLTDPIEKHYKYYEEIIRKVIRIARYISREYEESRDLSGAEIALVTVFLATSKNLDDFLDLPHEIHKNLNLCICGKTESTKNKLIDFWHTVPGWYINTNECIIYDASVSAILIDLERNLPINERDKALEFTFQYSFKIYDLVNKMITGEIYSSDDNKLLTKLKKKTNTIIDFINYAKLSSDAAREKFKINKTETLN